MPEEENMVADLVESFWPLLLRNDLNVNTTEPGVLDVECVAGRLAISRVEVMRGKSAQ